MVQINDDNYEDLTFESTTAVLDALASGRTPRPGSQTGRQASVPAGGPSTCRKWSARTTITGSCGSDRHLARRQGPHLHQPVRLSALGT
jgi:hypothetical protein